MRKNKLITVYKTQIHQLHVFITLNLEFLTKFQFDIQGPNNTSLTSGLHSTQKEETEIILRSLNGFKKERGS